jgi:hypothetical protein
MLITSHINLSPLQQILPPRVLPNVQKSQVTTKKAPNVSKLIHRAGTQVKKNQGEVKGKTYENVAVQNALSKSFRNCKMQRVYQKLFIEENNVVNDFVSKFSIYFNFLCNLKAEEGDQEFFNGLTETCIRDISIDFKNRKFMNGYDAFENGVEDFDAACDLQSRR